MVRDEAKATLVRGASTTAPVVWQDSASNFASKPPVTYTDMHIISSYECPMQRSQCQRLAVSGFLDTRGAGYRR